MRSRAAIVAVLGVKMLCGFVIFVSMTFTFFAVGPAMETRWWPVTSKVEIISVEPGPGETSIVRAAFRKYRNCEYIGVAWYVGTPESFERVSMTSMRAADGSDTSSPNRPVGYQRAGPWIIGATPDELKNRSFAQLTHRCHSFWTTVTNFYP